MPKTQTIRILGINPDKSLILSDNGITRVSRGDTVQWIIGPGSGVSAITGIQRTSTTNVFSPDPAPIGGSSMWRGQIDSGLPIPSEEEYCIHYISAIDNIEHKSDPKIQVDS
ncbi:hypothetical protein [Spirosoma pulveris]